MGWISKEIVRGRGLKRDPFLETITGWGIKCKPRQNPKVKAEDDPFKKHSYSSIVRLVMTSSSV